MNRHGDRLVVDLRPVEGRGGFHDPSRMDAVEDTLSDLLQGHWIKRVQIVNDVTQEQVRTLLHTTSDAVKVAPHIGACVWCRRFAVAGAHAAARGTLVLV